MKKYLIAFALLLTFHCSFVTPAGTNHTFLAKGYSILAIVTGLVAYSCFQGKDAMPAMGTVGGLGATYCALKGASHALKLLTS